jgi:iron complex outermembrane receptor protein
VLFRSFNASLTYRAENWEVALYGSNLTDEDYFQTYIDRSLLEDALGPVALIPGVANNLGIVGDGRRVGARLGFYF